MAASAVYRGRLASILLAAAATSSAAVAWPPRCTCCEPAWRQRTLDTGQQTIMSGGPVPTWPRHVGAIIHSVVAFAAAWFAGERPGCAVCN